jgi:signal transduction histidine kinase
LIGNALKFHRPDVSPVVEVYSRPAGSNRVEILVRDNGIGFDEQYRERIFQPFQRLHGRQRYEGTGIGLAICRKIVERHYGSIHVESKPDSGSVFHIFLPVRQVES